jgi:hypothetical protein
MLPTTMVQRRVHLLLLWLMVRPVIGILLLWLLTQRLVVLVD